MTKANPPEIDMSPEAVWRRLESVRALYKLMLYLKQYKPVETKR